MIKEENGHYTINIGLKVQSIMLILPILCLEIWQAKNSTDKITMTTDFLWQQVFSTNEDE